MVPFPSEALRTKAISSGDAPRKAAMRARAVSRIAAYFSRFCADASASMSRVAATTASNTESGDGARLPAFSITVPGTSGKRARTSCQKTSPGSVPGCATAVRGANVVFSAAIPAAAPVSPPSRLRRDVVMYSRLPWHPATSP